MQRKQAFGILEDSVEVTSNLELSNKNYRGGD